MIPWSEEAKRFILIELEVPREQRDKACERKSAKYQELVSDCREKGWQAWLTAELPAKCGECS